MAKKKIKNHEHEKMVDKLDALEKFEQAYPLLEYLHEMALSGNVDAALRKAAPAAVIRMVDVMMNGKTDKDKMAAAKDLLYMAGYKPVDKKVNVHADVDQMSERELDSLIMSAVKGLSDEEKKQIGIIEKRNREAKAHSSEEGISEASFTEKTEDGSEQDRQIRPLQESDKS